MSTTVRLDERKRRLIRERILNHAFSERAAALEAERNKAGLAIYIDVYPTQIRVKMNALPDGFLPSQNHLNVQVEGKSNLLTVHFGDYYMVSYQHAQNNNVPSYSKEQPLMAQYLSVKAAQEALKKERDEKEREVNGILNSVHTIGALAKAWPEAEPFFADFKPTTPNGGALSRDLRKLNDALGLPPTVPTTP